MTIDAVMGARCFMALCPFRGGRETDEEEGGVDCLFEVKANRL
jgi:hypothetical protein